MRSPLLCILMFTGMVTAAEPGLFVGVGGGGRRMTSTDGLKWENVSDWAETWADDSLLLHDVIYGKGKFVAVGGGGWSKPTQAGHILTSADGKEWKVAAKLPNRILPILFDGERFVAAGGGDGVTLRHSLDGEKWLAGATGKDLAAKRGEAKLNGFNFRKGAAGNGVFLFTGDADGKVSWRITSKDGTTIDTFQTGTPPVGGVAFGAKTFVIAGRDGVFTSADAVKWIREDGTPKDEMWRVLWSGTEFIATGKKGLYRSPDGKAWTAFGKKPNGWIAAAGPDGFLAANWGANLLHSRDGTSWTKVEMPAPPRQMEKYLYVPLSR